MSDNERHPFLETVCAARGRRYFENDEIYLLKCEREKAITNLGGLKARDTRVFPLLET